MTRRQIDSVEHSLVGVRFNDNERSYAIQLISEINEYVRQKDMIIKRAGGERTINGGTFVRFPDVLLFSDNDQAMMLQGWEVKCPDVPIDDVNFVADAREKADLLGCNSCVLWNFQHAQLHIKKEDGSFLIAKSWVISDFLVDRASIERLKPTWISFLHELINTLGNYITTGQVRHRSLGLVITDSVMPALINDNKGLVAEALKTKGIEDVGVSVTIGLWWKTSKSEYTFDEVDSYYAYAKLILLSWLNKLLFANIIQTHHEPARIVAEISEGCKVSQAQDYFADITRCCDFYHIFNTLDYEEVIPLETWLDVISFNQLLQECDISRLDSTYQHKLLEDNISVAKRQVAGQYPTPEPLAQLLAEIGVRNAKGNAWDCCCGTGTIAKAIWEHKVARMKDVDADAFLHAFDSVWASDIHDYPLQITTLSLSSLAQVDTPLRVFRMDVFLAGFGKAIDLTDPGSGCKVSIPIPKFDTIVSNLPFVDFNTVSSGAFNEIKRDIRQECASEGVNLSDRNDLYCYITLYIKRLLADGGTACLLTSNSWLLNLAGKGFLDALRALFDIEAIFINGHARWFDNADVMNALIILHPKSSLANPSVRFGVIDISTDDLQCEEQRHIISLSILSGMNQTPDTLYFHDVAWDMAETALKHGLSLYSLCFDMQFMEDILPALCPVLDQFTVERGSKSGQNDAFYSDDPSFVDKEYCHSLAKDLKTTGSFIIKPRKYVLDCDDSKDYLQQNGFTKTLNYINAVESRGVTVSAKGHRPFWYSLPKSSSFVFGTAMNPSRRLFFARVKEGERCYADQRVICFMPNDDSVDLDLCFALLNSTLGMLLLEANAGPMALGALDTRKDQIARLNMLNPSLIDRVQRKEILRAFAPLLERDIGDTDKELEREDRDQFDRSVLKAFGLEDKLGVIKATLLHMQQVRLR